MKKSLCALLLAALFAFVAVGASFAAKIVECDVNSVNADKVMMTCKSANLPKAGEKIRIRKHPVGC